MFDNNQYKNPYSMYDPNYITKLEQENKMLKEKQQQMSDPMYVEFQQTPEYQMAKKDNFLTFLFENTFQQWQSSPLGQQFVEWDKKQYENYKQQRIAQINKPKETNVL